MGKTIEVEKLKEIFKLAGIPNLTAYSMARACEMEEPDLLRISFDRHIKRLEAEKDEKRAKALREEEESIDELEKMSAQIASSLGDITHPDTLSDGFSRDELREIYRSAKEKEQIFDDAEKLDRQIALAMGVLDE